MPRAGPRRSDHSRHGDRDGHPGSDRNRRASSQRIRIARRRPRGRDRGARRISAERLLLRLSTHRRIGEAMDRLPAARRFVRRFVAGPVLEDALGVVARLNAEGVDAAVTHLGENVATADDAAHATDAYLEVLDEIARRRLQAVPSLKLTHLGLDLGESVCRANLERVASRGLATRTLVWVDMESSAYTDRTLDLYRALHADAFQPGLRRSGLSSPHGAGRRASDRDRRDRSPVQGRLSRAAGARVPRQARRRRELRPR